MTLSIRCSAKDNELLRLMVSGRHFSYSELLESARFTVVKALLSGLVNCKDHQARLRKNEAINTFFAYKLVVIYCEKKLFSNFFRLPLRIVMNIQRN